MLTVSAFNQFANTVEPDGDLTEERIREVRLAILKEYRGFFARREERTFEVLASTDSLLLDSLHRLALADSGKKLRKWQRSPILRWEGGSAVIRPSEIRISPEVSFENALPTLVNLTAYNPLDSARASQDALK
ncbi:MAG TPA: hypothetical protein VJ385_06230 [Fibrobacteria bacterium]|nr:hypothetical protein [Fibrobacteria bacterium]